MSSSKKAVIISKQILFDARNQLCKNNLWIVDIFEDNKIEFVILARSSSIGEMKGQLPTNYKEKISFIDRSQNTKQKVIQLRTNNYLFSVVGLVDEDAFFSFNCKLPLFNPKKMLNKGVEVSEKIDKYGLPITDFEEVVDCMLAFDVHKGNYFEMHVDDQFSVISLNNANTYYRPEEEARIKKIFETNLKGDEHTRNQRILLILLFHLINEVTTNEFYNEVDFWGTFPSSNPANTATAISFLKEAIRVILNGKPRTGPEILIRQKAMQPKHSSCSLRLEHKCNKDFETLSINNTVLKNIKGKVVCIIDDYITNGYSAESAKHLLLKAGAKKVIFISIGKFGKNYFLTDYNLMENNFEFVGESLAQGDFYDLTNDNEILNFKDLV